MLILDHISKSIVGVMSAVVDTTAPVAFATYGDSSEDGFIEGGSDISFDGTDMVTLVEAPVQGARRLIRSIIITNTDDIAHEFTIFLKTDPGILDWDEEEEEEIEGEVTCRPIVIVSLGPGESYAVSHGEHISSGGGAPVGPEVSYTFVLGDGAGPIRDEENKEDMIDIQVDRDITITNWTIIQSKPDDEEGDIVLDIRVSDTFPPTDLDSVGTAVLDSGLGHDYVETESGLSWDIDKGDFIRVVVEEDSVLESVDQVTLMLNGVRRSS